MCGILYERHIAVDQGTGRGLHNDGLHHLCSSKKIFRIIKETKIRWTGCGTDGGEERYVEGFGGETRGKETAWKT